MQALLILAPHPPPLSIKGILNGISIYNTCSYFMQVLPGDLPDIKFKVFLYSFAKFL